MTDITVVDYASSYIMQKMLADVYERMYAYVASDFVNHEDNLVRENNEAAFFTQLLSLIQTIIAHINTHIHTSGASGSPTSPPTVTLSPGMPDLPVFYENTTGTTTNFANQVTEFEYLSYVDLRTSGNINQPIVAYRRATPIPINSDSVTSTLIRQ